MKRMSALLAACLLCMCLGACGAEPSAPANFPDPNFNNQYWFSGDFWAFADQVFYMQDGFYNMGVYRSAGGKNERLFAESDFVSDAVNHTAIRDIYVCGSWLYFRLTEDSHTTIYRYDLTDGTCAPVCQTPALFRWAVLGDRLIYREHPSNSPQRYSPLCIYHLETGTTTQVCTDVEEFGIVDGQLRYITGPDEYELYQYSFEADASTLLGSFRREFDDVYDIFNFTPDSVVMMNWSRQYNRSLVIYTISSGTTAVCTLPRGLHNLVACDQYAYAVVYDSQEYSSAAVPAPENGIYRISLADGSWEILSQPADDDTEIHVAGDGSLYIIQRKYGLFFRSDRHVYRFDCATGHREELTVM